MDRTESRFSQSLRSSLRLFLAGGVFFATGFALSLLVTPDTVSSPQMQTHSPEAELVPRDGNIHGTFTAVAARVRPAVVFIKTERRASSSDGSSERLGPFDFFREMFPEDGDRTPRRQGGGGSGFIIDEQGRILTNHHVIRDADKITVVLGVPPNEEEYEASVVGVDEYSDIAVIKIDADIELPVVALGDSDEMMVGDWVMAIGTPFGQLSGTVTVGVVSAKGRTDLRIMGGTADYQNFIQTDASINFGNSGGPLVNLRGEAVGINTAINPSGQGIGFAIPINMAKGVSRQLIEKGRVQYGFMGIRLQELNKTLAKGLDLDIDHGILVNEVLPPEQLLPRAREIADLLAGGPTLVFAAIKEVLRETETMGFHEAMKLITSRKLKTVDELYSSADQLEGARAFADKRDPTWTGE